MSQRFIVADWGTTRFRAYLVEGAGVLDVVSSPEGVSALKAGEHAGVFRRACGAWLDAEPSAPVALVGMVGSREGWATAPYAACPAGPAEIARAMIPVDLGGGREARIVPGLTAASGEEGVDVMRGEETLALGAGVSDGLICLPGTHSKWVLMRGGRVERFATYMTGELYGLLRHHSMIGRPATEPEDPAGFARGLAAARRNAPSPGGPGVGLLHLLFGARAATVTGRMSPEVLGPYLSGLLTGDEVQGALAQLGLPAEVAIVAEQPRAGLYEAALGERGIRTRTLAPRDALIAGLGRILAA
jgi:2-dehydro-3-deoxygalactonokinase